MNRTVKEATIKAFHYPDLDRLKAHVLALVAAYNFANTSEPSDGRHPSKPPAHTSTTPPDIFKLNPRHLTPGPNTLPSAALSFHLNQLEHAHLVKFRRESRSLIYTPESYLTENCCQGDAAACGLAPCEPAIEKEERHEAPARASVRR